MSTISYETVIWTIRYFIFAAVMLSVLVIVSSALIMSVNVQEVESRVFINRVIYSENMNYVDGNNRIHAGVIDINKFDSQHLEKEFANPDELNLASEITIYEAGKDSSQRIYFNRKWYERWEPLVGIAGKGGVSFVQRNVSVAIKQGEDLKKGVLQFRVITQNN